MSSDAPEFQQPDPSTAGSPQPGVQASESQPGDSQQQGNPQNPPVEHGESRIPPTPPPGYTQPQPGYTQPQPGYTQPQHTPPPGYTQPPPGYTQPPPGYTQPQPGYTQLQPGYTQPQHTPPGYNYPRAATPPLSPADEKQRALLTHVLGIFFGWLTSTIMFLVYGKRGPFVRSHTASDLNFQLTTTIGVTLGTIVALVGDVITASSDLIYDANDALLVGNESALATGLVVLGIGVLIIATLLVIRTIFGILAAVAANRGRFYKFPMSIPFIRTHDRQE